MCGGGSSAPPPMPQVDQYKGPPGPGRNIGGVPLGLPNYQDQAKALMSVGETYGQLASGLAGILSQQMPRTMSVATPPAPTSAFSGGIGEYLAARGTQPFYGRTPAMQAIESYEMAYDPRTSATQLLEAYDPVTEARPLSYYTPESLENVDFKQPDPFEQIRRRLEERDDESGLFGRRLRGSDA